MALDIPVTVESSETIPVTKLESVATCILYEAALDDAFHCKVSDVG
jgi:hypothetical protein